MSNREEGANNGNWLSSPFNTSRKKHRNPSVGLLPIDSDDADDPALSTRPVAPPPPDVIDETEFDDAISDDDLLDMMVPPTDATPKAALIKNNRHVHIAPGTPTPGGYQYELEDGDVLESFHGIGSRKLGFRAVAIVKKLEKKERSQRRIFESQRTASAGLSSETSPLVSRSEDGSSFFDDADVPEETLLEVLKDVIFGKIVSVLLLAMPFAVWSGERGWDAVWVFWFNFLVMIPLASILGDFTEEVAAHTNQVIGGLINATFGNAVEVVVAIQALLANEIRVVQASMIGSIFSNLLLVLGGCFFMGGLVHKEQNFNATAATANMGLLALSSVALVLPTPFAQYYEVEDEHVLIISRMAAIFLMFMYLQLLVFQLKTHTFLFDEEDDEGPARLSMTVSLCGLCITTLLITVFSDYLVGSIDGFVSASGVSRTFVGLIILPIVGNAVEHITAVTVAMKNKMDLAMGIAIGSCTQISLFVVPLTVLVGWMTNRDMTLNFPHFEIVLFVLAVFTVSVCLSNPKGNWLEGSLLMTTYLMIAVGFWYEDVVDF